MAAYLISKYYKSWDGDRFRGVDCVFTNRKQAEAYAAQKTKNARELTYVVETIPLNPKKIQDGVCGNCGSTNVLYLMFDADGMNKGFQEFECRACGSSTYQTFDFTITSQEVTLREDRE